MTVPSGIKEIYPREERAGGEGCAARSFFLADGAGNARNGNE